MAYIINTYNGTLITTVQDGTVDQTLDVQLPGKNYAGYGTIQNENYVYLLEHFANSTEPPKAIRGQVWFDTTTKKLKVFTGDLVANVKIWKTVGGADYGSSEPNNPTQGDLWLDTNSNQLKIRTSSTWLVVGPQTAGSGVTQMISRQVRADDASMKSIIAAVINDIVVYIISKESFTIDPYDPPSQIDGFTKIKNGITLAGTDPDTGVNDETTALFWATAANSLRLGGYEASAYIRASATDYLLRDGSLAMTGPLTLSGDPTSNVHAATKQYVDNQAARTITLTGDIQGSGTTDITANLTNTGVGAGDYTKVTVNTKGRVINGANPTTLIGYGITDAQPLNTSLTNISNVSTSVSGYLAYDKDTTTWSLQPGSGGGGSVTLTGDVTGTGTGNVATTLTSLHAGGSGWTKINVDAKGRVTGNVSATTLADYGITDAQPLDADLTAISAVTGSGLLRKSGTSWAIDTLSYLTLESLPSLCLGMKVFTSSGSYVSTTGTKSIIVFVTGGGGGGGNAGTTSAYSSGGGAGGTAIKYLAVVGTLTATVTVGTGGTGSLTDTAGNGTTSMFNTPGGVYIYGYGGSGSNNASGAVGPYAAGGSASGGNINISGGSSAQPYGASGIGGTSFWGGGGASMYNTRIASVVNGYAYGSGGAGMGGGTNVSGGNGAGGVVVVFEFG